MPKDCQDFPILVIHSIEQIFARVYCVTGAIVGRRGLTYYTFNVMLTHKTLVSAGDSFLLLQLFPPKAKNI